MIVPFLINSRLFNRVKWLSRARPLAYVTAALVLLRWALKEGLAGVRWQRNRSKMLAQLINAAVMRVRAYVGLLLKEVSVMLNT